MKPEDPSIRHAFCASVHHDDHHGGAARRGALAVGSGSGSELRRPLGITIIGGLLISQLLTLYTTPVIYIWFDRLAARISRKPAAGKVPAAPNRSGRVIHEYFGALHPQARGHHTPGGRDCIGGRGGIPAAPGVAAAAGGVSDHLRERRFAGASPETMASSWRRRWSASSDGLRRSPR